MALAAAMGGVANHVAIPTSTPMSLPARVLPGKHVDQGNIEDVFVAFIFYCNPAVPADSDTKALRDAFRTPPKSGGKSFSTFALFELIKELEAKELKTWAELVLKLGVEPPDAERGESAQKIQQYAVRLKRWMHALHVDAFFDYLVGVERSYWTEVPTSFNPAAEDGREGVAAEDDMALRALLPHIKPKRGRRKPEDDLNKSPAQRARLRSPNFIGGDKIENPWTAHPDGVTGRAFVFPPVQGGKQNPMQIPQSAYPWHSDTPMSAFPQSAVAAGSAFWGDPIEPQSAITPSRARANPRRHGAKVVSSAWRSNLSAQSRGRGRPPTSNKDAELSSAHPDSNRGRLEVFPEEPRVLSQSSPPLPTTGEPLPEVAMASSDMMSDSPIATPTSQQPRPARPGRLSLQVPERQGGSVRLATPPAPTPPVIITPPPVFASPDGATSHARQGSIQKEMQRIRAGADGGPPRMSQNLYTSTPASSTDGTPSNRAPVRTSMAAPGVNGQLILQAAQNGSVPDRTNCNGVESILMMRFLTAFWLEPDGSQAPAPDDMEEISALVNAIINGLRRKAGSSEAFLMSLSGLLIGSSAGNASLLTNGESDAATKKKSGLTVQRVEIAADYTRYQCSWEMRYADATAKFTHDDVIPHSRWKKGFIQQQNGGGNHSVSGDSETAGDSEDGSMTSKDQHQAAAEFWKKKFATLAQTVSAMEQSS